MPIIKPKLKYSLICDDVRHEVGNKVSFIGVYTKDLFIPQTPFTFPKLCAYLLYEKVKGGISFNSVLIDPSGKKIGKGMDIEIPKDVKKPIDFGMLCVFAPLRIEQAGSYKIEVRYKTGKEHMDCVEFSIKCRE